MTRGIYLIANYKSQDICENLIYSIRNSGCNLPIRIIHFGGKKINSKYILSQVEYLRAEDFSTEAQAFIHHLRSVISDCPMGYLYRFLALFSDWDEFIYSDNDIVALLNWEKLFEYLPGHHIVHADEEYITEGRFNHNNPSHIIELFGEDALEKAITAGHFLMCKSDKIINDLNTAVEWYKSNANIAKKHDQALLHIAALIGSWSALNLCKPPYNWLSSWAGDYRNSLQLVQKILQSDSKGLISHLHYSGMKPEGNTAIEDLIFASQSDEERLKSLMNQGLKKYSGISYCQDKVRRVKRRLHL